MISRVSLPERCFAFLGICYYEQGLVAALRYGRGDSLLRPGETDPLSTAVQLAVGIGVTTLLVARHRQAVPLVRPLLPYAAILALCFASVFWSDLPLQSFRRSLSLAICVLLGTYLFVTFGLERTVEMAARCTVFLGVLSIGVYLALPSIGAEIAQGYEHAMRGVFPQKNPMCQNMVLGLTWYLHRIARRGRPTGPDLACTVILLTCLVMGRSVSSLLVAALLIAVTAVSFGGRLRPFPLFLAGWALLGALSLLWLAPGLLAEWTGRDGSLTGRIPLWREVLDVAAQHPWFGFGYAGFWNGETVAVRYLWLRTGWQPPDSHNGYLEVLLQLGTAGLLLYGWLLGRALRLAWAADAAMAGWLRLFLLATLALNLDEAPLASPDSFTMLMPAALAAAAAWQARRLPLPRFPFARPA